MHVELAEVEQAALVQCAGCHNPLLDCLATQHHLYLMLHAACQIKPCSRPDINIQDQVPKPVVSRFAEPVGHALTA